VDIAPYGTMVCLAGWGLSQGWCLSSEYGEYRMTDLQKRHLYFKCASTTRSALNPKHLNPKHQKPKLYALNPKTQNPKP